MFQDKTLCWRPIGYAQVEAIMEQVNNLATHEIVFSPGICTVLDTGLLLNQADARNLRSEWYC